MREVWKEVIIGDLGQVITGNTPPKKDADNYGGSYPFIKPTDMDIDRRYVASWEENYSDKAFKRYKNSYIPPKATGVVTIGTVGEKMFQADQFCFTNQSVNVVIPSKNYDENFIYYLLKYNLPKVENANPGTASGRHHVSKSNFCAIKLNVPSLPTQRKIASILSSYDDLIENNLKRIKLLEEKAQLTYEEWFVKMRFPGNETAKFDEVTGLPEGWEKKMLSQISDYIGRGISPKYVEEDGFSIINQKCIRDNRVDKSLCRLTDTSKKILQDKILQSFDILINSTGTGTLGRVAQILTVNELLTVDTHVTIVRAGENISKIFLGRSLEYNQERIEKLGKGATNQIELSRHDLGELIVIDLPTLELQNLYEIKFKPNYQAIDKLIIQNRLLKEARDILLPRLMSGMIDVEQLEAGTLQTT